MRHVKRITSGTSDTPLNTVIRIALDTVSQAINCSMANVTPDAEIVELARTVAVDYELAQMQGLSINPGKGNCTHTSTKYDIARGNLLSAVMQKYAPNARENPISMRVAFDQAIKIALPAQPQR